MEIKDRFTGESTEEVGWLDYSKKDSTSQQSRSTHTYQIITVVAVVVANVIMIIFKVHINYIASGIKKVYVFLLDKPREAILHTK